MNRYPEKIKILQGDITKIPVDAIVNAANTSLLGGGGVDGAIHRAGGSAILEECTKIRDRQGGCETGSAVITTAGKLPARFVIHAVGPIWRGGGFEEEKQLSSAYSNSLRLAVQNQVRRISFPNISTGVYHFPKNAAANIAITAVNEFLNLDPEKFDELIFVCYDLENYKLYQQLLSAG